MEPWTLEPKNEMPWNPMNKLKTAAHNLSLAEVGVS